MACRRACVRSDRQIERQIGASFRLANALIGEGSTMLSNVAVLRSLP